LQDAYLHSSSSIIFYRAKMYIVECRNLIHQLIEPNPELRIPMSEIQLNHWITSNGKCPFVPYVAPAKNRVMRSQVYSSLLTALKQLTLWRPLLPCGYS